MAEIDGGALSFKSVMDNDQMNAAIEETLRRVQGLSDGTVAGGKKIDAAFDMMAADIEEGFRFIDMMFDTHKVALKNLENEYKQLGEEAAKAFSQGKDKKHNSLLEKQKEIGGEIELRKQLIKEVEKQADALQKGEQKLNKMREQAEKTANAHISFRTQLRNAREELIRMEQAGERGTRAYVELQQQVGQLQDAMDDATQQARVLANDEGMMQGVISGLSGVAGGFSAATGTMSLFADENENLQKVMVKVQSLMAITIGLQQVQQTLNKDSYFKLKILVPMQNMYSAAVSTTGKSLVRLGVSANTARIAVHALYGALTLGLSVAIGAGIYLWNKYSDSQKKAAEETKKMLEIEKDGREEMFKARIEIEQTKKELQNFTGTKEQEKQKVDELNRKYGESFGYYKTLTEWYDALLQKGEDYIQMLFMQAKVQSLVNKAVEANEKVEEVKSQNKNDVDGSMGWFAKMGLYMAQGESQGQIDAQKLIDQHNETAKKKAVKTAEDIRDGYLKEAEKIQDSILELRKKGIGGFVDITKTDNKTKKEDPVIKQIEERKKAYSDYYNWVNKGLGKEAQIEFAETLKGGNTYLEYLNKLKQNTTLTKEQLHTVLNEIANETNGSIMNTFKQSLSEQMGNAKTIIDQLKVIQDMRDDLNKPGNNDPLKSQKTEILDDENEKAEEKRKQETAQILSEYADIHDSKLDLDTKYFADLALLKEQKETALTDEEKQRLDRTIAYRKQRYNEDVQNLLQATTNAKIRMAGLKCDNTLIEISNKKYLFEADRQKDMLEARKKATQETLAQLQKLQSESPTEELASEIEQVKLEIKELNVELGKMPNNKFQEALSGLQKITSALSGLEGDVGEIFSGISSQIDNIKVGFDETASTTDKVSAGIAGIVDIINMISSASAKRKQVEKEFYQNQIALAHEYALALNDILRTQSELSGGGFVADYAGKINDGFSALSDAAKNYQEALGKLSEGKAKLDLRNAIDWGNAAKGAGAGAAAGAAIGSVVPVIGTAIGAVAGAIIGGFAGLFGGKKKKEEYGGLLGVFPELIDGAGNLNKELAQTLINTNQVDDKTKQLIQNALDWADAMETAHAQIKEVVVDLAGDLGSSLKNSIVEAWKAGEDASKKMFDTAGKSLEKFVEDLLYSTIFSEVFDEFADRLADSLSPNGDGDVLDDYDWLMDEMDARDDYFISLLEQVKKRAQERGFDNAFENDESSATDTSLTGAVKGVSEKTASLVAGQMNAIRINQLEATAIMRQQLAALSTIANNTSYNYHLAKLERIVSLLEAQSGNSLRSQGLS